MYDPSNYEMVEETRTAVTPRPYEQMVKEAAAAPSPSYVAVHRVPFHGSQTIPADNDWRGREFVLTPQAPERRDEAYWRHRPTDAVKTAIRLEIRRQKLTGVLSCTVRSDKSQEFHPLILNDDGTISIIVHRTLRSFQ